ncbi:hypothetical protein AAGS40_23220 [Paraburkholderia sp. PREW-6R]|uniref:hypothetical protein n=1 Tax=Paraburkholderia sp. PREW-6R TaxID=3141544 RepID=UPI0031F5043E
MLTKFVKPTRGVVLMPERAYREMRAEGEEVPVNPYYLQLLRFGDVVEIQPPAVAGNKPAPVPAGGAAAS